MKKNVFLLCLNLVFLSTAYSQEIERGGKRNFLEDKTKGKLKEAEEIKFETQTIDYGKIQQGTPQKREFVFKNVSKAPVVLLNVRNACECTAPEWPKEPIFPGETGKITIKYNAQKGGVFNKIITVIYNGSKLKHLNIKGEVVEKMTRTSKSKRAKLQSNTITPK